MELAPDATTASRTNGDALELETRMSGQSKSETMQMIAQFLIKESRTALEPVTRNCEPPPTWIQTFMTLAEWAHYQELRGQVDPGCATLGAAGSCSHNSPSGTAVPPAQVLYRYSLLV